jgi:two-component system, LytTR family, response regulator
MKGIIVDHDAESISILGRMIGSVAPQLEIVATCSDPLDAIAKIRALNPQIVFLHVSLQNVSCFEILEQIEQRAFEVIITADTEKHALKALKVGAIDYLVKPFAPEELREATEKVAARKNGNAAQQLEMLMNHFKPQKPKVRRVALTASDHLVFVDTNDIIYCESDSNYTTFFLVKGEKVVISKTLKDVEELLEGDDFFRIHASYLINMKHVSKFTRGDGGYVVMSNNQNITVSRKKKEEFFEKFSKL